MPLRLSSDGLGACVDRRAGVAVQAMGSIAVLGDLERTRLSPVAVRGFNFGPFFSPLEELRFWYVEWRRPSDGRDLVFLRTDGVHFANAT